jgi:ADP-ribose pyrophosphatase YjhB (NUDIX family)
MIPNWLLWARELQATAQTGLTFVQNPYDEARYKAMQELAGRMMSEAGGGDLGQLDTSFATQRGYATPKVDVRACIFRKNEVLLVSEMIDGNRWTFPGGFADVNETPSEAAEREVQEEAGFVVKAAKLAGVYDRDKRGGTRPYPYHIYKLLFICEITGRCEKSNLETGDPQWFPIDALPELSTDRTQVWHIQRMYEHFLHPEMPTDFD